MNKQYIIYILYSIIGIGFNLYAFQNGGSLEFVIGSVLSAPLLVLTVEKFIRRFDFPLFFIRNDGLNWWGGAFGGSIAILSYIIGLIAIPSLSTLDMFSFIFLLINFSIVVMILYTATILRDIELGYIEVSQE